MKEAFVVGSGPNGLTAAIVLARAGVKVTVLEAQSTYGGGARSLELTLPGFLHDLCSAVHPLAVSSPIFAQFPLGEHGLEWIHPPIPFAHPLDGGEAALLHRSVADTARDLGSDAARYERTMEPLARRWSELVTDLLAPPHWPRHPSSLFRFCLLAPWPATFLSRSLFRTREARALFAGCAAHSVLPLEKPGSAAFGLVLTVAAHAVGWPIPRGGSQRVADALVSYFESLGGLVVRGNRLRSLDEIPQAATVLCDITPRQLLSIAGEQLPARYRAQLERFRYGPGVFKVDWALSAAIPWADSRCRNAGTVHIGGTIEEIAASERAPWKGHVSQKPFVLLAQPSLFDSLRAPQGSHTAWAYCHVPNASSQDMLDRIEDQIERFAPGFRKHILARSTSDTAAMQHHNENLVGGDINGGSTELSQLFLRPTPSLYRTPLKRVYLCSSSTPPGGGVHGMCGYHAARAALADASV